MEYEKAESIIDTYGFDELLEENELTEADVLCFLVQYKLITLPELKPLDFNE